MGNILAMQIADFLAESIFLTYKLKRKKEKCRLLMIYVIHRNFSHLNLIKSGIPLRMLVHSSSRTRPIQDMLCALTYYYQWDSLKSLLKMSVFTLFWPRWVFVNSLTFNGIISYGQWRYQAFQTSSIYLIITEQNQRKFICLLWFLWW